MDGTNYSDVKSNDEVSVDALVDLSPLLKVDADVDLHIHRRDDTIDLEATVDLSDILLGSVDLSHLDLSSLDLSHLDLGEGDLSALLVRLNGLLHHTDTQTESPATTETPPVLGESFTSGRAYTSSQLTP
jgi:hypothetical protein